MKKYFLIAICLGTTIGIFLLFQNKHRNQPKVVFCDVGQGDGIYIRLPENVDILVDTGPHKKILTCLNRYMPYFDRDIDMIFLTHPQKDHVGGLSWILKGYKVKNVFVPDALLNEKFVDYSYWVELKNLIQSHKIHIGYVSSRQQIKFANSVINILWPKKNTPVTNIKRDINNIGIIIEAHVNEYSLLLTADVDYTIVERLLEKPKNKNTLLKIGHHGSKTSTSPKLLQLADPLLAVISSGKFNSYGHPHKDVLLSIQSLKIPIKRTDTDGDVFYSLQ